MYKVENDVKMFHQISVVEYVKKIDLHVEIRNVEKDEYSQKIRITLWLTRLANVIYRKFIEVLEVMREDWSDCANNDICMRETVRKAKVSERVTKVMMILHTTTIVTYSIGTILADIDVTNNTTELLFYTKVEFPFDVNTQRTYRFILAIDFFFLLMCSWCAGIMNTLLLILVSYKFSNNIQMNDI